MPNWCWNVATISHTDTEKMAKIKAELAKDKPELFNMLRPRPPEDEDNWYMWNCEYWGTKWDANVYDTDWLNDNTLKITMDTAWSPPIALYHFLFEEGYDVEAFYHEEGMAFCGRYDFGSDEYYEYGNLDSEGIRENIPTDIDELFGLSDRAEEREAEEAEEDEDEDDEDEEEGPFTTGYQYETTDWFDKDVKPVREGTYEVMTESWPFPQKCVWAAESWEHPGGTPITQWRGITEWEHNMHAEMEKLKEEFDRLMEKGEKSD